ncbi:MAG: hypothetical protein WCJ60_02805 [bacterium]
MARDFEQLIFDARHWLRESKPKPTISNELGNFGIVRRNKTIIVDPLEIVAAIESTSILKASRRVGAIILSATADKEQDSAVLHWDTEGSVKVLSSLTYVPNEYVPLSRLTGILLDRVYERFAPAMQQVLQTLE